MKVRTKKSTIGTRNIRTSIAIPGSSNSGVGSRGALAAAGERVQAVVMSPVMARPAG